VADIAVAQIPNLQLVQWKQWQDFMQDALKSEVPLDLGPHVR